MSESSIGEVLRLAREQQGLTLQDVSDALNIKRAYLEALEKDEYDAIPGAVFVKGYLRNYGNFLELDGVALAKEYKENVEERTPQPEVRTIMPMKKKKVRKEPKKKKQRQGKWPEITIIAGIIIFLLLIIWILI
ncbi:RodZ family helix-turn-helix domain-containing protein [Megasphaera sp.]|uniref:helix-turn-helix domain-containing protein n=1 Tax=Megasphaera sp. TaxID=2023260 RepID=UPI0025F0F6F5|nr:helix-turn-helix domain-containing protein [uncultured Megasphaera sp.]